MFESNPQVLVIIGVGFFFQSLEKSKLARLSKYFLHPIGISCSLKLRYFLDTLSIVEALENQVWGKLA